MSHKTFENSNKEQLNFTSPPEGKGKKLLKKPFCWRSVF